MDIIILYMGCIVFNKDSTGALVEVHRQEDQVMET